MNLKLVVIVSIFLSNTVSFGMLKFKKSPQKRDFTQALKSQTCFQCGNKEKDVICSTCHPSTLQNQVIKKQRRTNNPSEN